MLSDDIRHIIKLLRIKEINEDELFEELTACQHRSEDMEDRMEELEYKLYKKEERIEMLEHKLYKKED